MAPATGGALPPLRLPPMASNSFGVRPGVALWPRPLFANRPGKNAVAVCWPPAPPWLRSRPWLSVAAWGPPRAPAGAPAPRVRACPPPLGGGARAACRGLAGRRSARGGGSISPRPWVLLHVVPA